jgi:L-asparaginase/Glu-tRNA(Gln) amidotransferase subunit D
LAATLDYILRRIQTSPHEQIIAGMGTDTTDILLPFLDAFLFDSHALPVLISGANRSHHEKQSDAPANFHNLAASTHLPLHPGAYYIFHQTLYKGGDIIKVDPNEDPTSLEGMMTFFAPQRTQTKIGFLQNGLRQAHHTNLKKSIDYPYSAEALYETINSVITINLGDLNSISNEIEKILNPQYKAILIQSHALGNTPNTIKKTSEEALKQGKLVINCSRCLISNTSERYGASLSSLNQRELKNSPNKILSAKKLNNRIAKALLVRALLEKRDQSETQKLIDSYIKRTF